jgi:hypothetical protein
VSFLRSFGIRMRLAHHTAATAGNSMPPFVKSSQAALRPGNLGQQTGSRAKQPNTSQDLAENRRPSGSITSPLTARTISTPLLVFRRKGDNKVEDQTMSQAETARHLRVSKVRVLRLIEQGHLKLVGDDPHSPVSVASVVATQSLLSRASECLDSLPIITGLSTLLSEWPMSPPEAATKLRALAARLDEQP